MALGAVNANAVVVTGTINVRVKEEPYGTNKRWVTAGKVCVGAAVGTPTTSRTGGEIHPAYPQRESPCLLPGQTPEGVAVK